MSGGTGDAAEHDLLRYVVSVLMLSWGRRLSRGPWSGFSLAGCIGAYERERGVAVDRALGAPHFEMLDSSCIFPLLSHERVFLLKSRRSAGE